MANFSKHLGATTVSLTNIVLRLATTGSKFLLMLVLARVLTPDDVGVFGLVTSALIIAVYLAGMEYHNFTSREILGSDTSARLSLFGEQAIVHLAAYAVAAPVIFFFLDTGLIPQTVVFWFVPLLIAEHLSLEGYRLLITLSQSGRANVVLFVRSGLWALAIFACLPFCPEAYRRLDLIWPVWLASSSSAVLLAAWWLRSIWQSGPWSLDCDRIKRGFRTALPFLVSTLSLRGIFAMDRYFIELYHSTDQVGVYTLFFGTANFIYLMVEAGAAVVQYPKMVADFRKGDKAGFRSSAGRFVRSVIGATILGAAAAAVGIYPMLFLIDRPVYRDNIGVFWILVLGTSLYALSLIPHYLLYAKGRDRAVALSSAAAIASAVVFNFLLTPDLGARGAAGATLLAMGTLLALKTFFALKKDKAADS